MIFQIKTGHQTYLTKRKYTCTVYVFGVELPSLFAIKTWYGCSRQQQWNQQWQSATSKLVDTSRHGWMVVMVTMATMMYGANVCVDSRLVDEHNDHPTERCDKTKCISGIRQKAIRLIAIKQTSCPLTANLLVYSQHTHAIPRSVGRLSDVRAHTRIYIGAKKRCRNWWLGVD